eukprot:591228-Pelagomonas_calceolata.AAC.9
MHEMLTCDVGRNARAYNILLNKHIYGKNDGNFYHYPDLVKVSSCRRFHGGGQLAGVDFCATSSS